MPTPLEIREQVMREHGRQKPEPAFAYTPLALGSTRAAMVSGFPRYSTAILDQDNTVVGFASSPMQHTARRRAHLFAAAPELLDACETALGYLIEQHAPEALLAAMRAAIAKAAGK